MASKELANYKVVTTVPSEVINAAQNAGAALAGAVNSTMESINALSAPQLPISTGTSTLSTELIGFGNYSVANMAASGGYVLYPNKPNNNTAQAVYHK